MPRPNSPVIPDGWEAHHRPVAEATMTATCTVARVLAGTFNGVEGKSAYPTPSNIYTGACRVQAASRFALLAQAGEKPTTTRHYLVSIPLSATQPQVNDLVTVTAATDAALVGLRLIVTDIKGGSLVWERDLVCEVHEPTNR
jgi:hypothetical protein